MVALGRGAVRPLSVADDPLVAVGEVLGVRCEEDEHGERECGADDPDSRRDAERHSPSHTRSQRVHDGHVPATVRVAERFLDKENKAASMEYGWRD